jgi:hypothetical protein
VNVIPATQKAEVGGSWSEPGRGKSVTEKQTKEKGEGSVTQG